MNYLQWIDDQIAGHEREIARLTIARSVVEQASSDVRAHAPKEPKEPKPRKTKGKFIKGKTRDAIVDVMKIMRDAGDLPAMSSDITKVVRANNEGLTEKAVWNAMYNARATGHIVRDAEGRYDLPKPVEAAPEQAA